MVFFDYHAAYSAESSERENETMRYIEIEIYSTTIYTTCNWHSPLPHFPTHTHLPIHSRIKVLDVMLCTRTETDCLIKCKLVSRQMRIYPLCIYPSQFSITRTQCIHCVLICILLVVVVVVVVFFFRCLFAVPCGSLASTRRARSIQQFIERFA